MRTDNENKVAIVSLGTELVQGFTPNTNAHWMAGRLRDMGFEVAYQITLPDDAVVWNATWEMIQRARVRTVILGGGLGPTEDDKTRQLVADTLREPLEFRPEWQKIIREFIEKRRHSYSAANDVQAFFPRTSEVLDNPVGSAPGFRIAKNGVTLFALPGVPSESKAMFERHLVPFLKSKNVAPLFFRELRISGIFESDMAERFKRVRFPESVSWSSLPERDCIVFRTYAKESPEVLSKLEKELLSALNAPQSVISTDGKNLVETVAALLSESGETLSTAESCTGGMIASEIVNVPGASAFFKGGACTYWNEAKRDILGVPQAILDAHSAVSRETAIAMAAGAKRKYGTDWAVSTTGIAGPDGGTPEKPVGLVWMGIASPENVFAFRENFSGNRVQIREKSVFKVLDLLRKSILEHKSTCTKVQ